ncbi:unnamed protein product [Meganyctiphanes norvegica]|uniref:C-type lectin domain-containing protein n=1 Tax=Meganyctiphanes norvegica TaxID=48144 RepID=A0AAV2QKQ6_MEGNR
MDWHWNAILLILCISHNDYVKACDDDFKKALLQEFENLLDNKLSSMNAQMNQINGRLATFESKLEVLDGIPGDINAGTDDLDGMSSEAQLAIDNLKKMQENLMNKFEVFDESINEIKSLSNNSLKELNNIKSSIEENLTRVENDISMILSDVKQVTVPINDMAGSIINIEQNIEYFKVPITELHFLEHQSNALLKGMKQAFKGPSNTNLLQDTHSMKGALLVLEENVSTKLESVGKNISTRLDKWDQETDSLNRPLLDVEGKLSIKLESIKKSISSTLENLVQQRIKSDKRLLSAIYQEIFCVSTKCFKLFKDVSRTWTDAKTKCEEAGLILAQVPDAIAIPLRKIVVEKFGSAESWLGAKGNGSMFVWQYSGSVLMANSSLFDDGKHNAGSDRCIELDAYSSGLSSYPTQPYDGNTCSSVLKTLCEIIWE